MPPMPGPGEKAPAFKARTSTGRARTLASFRGALLVLYFYPKDNTPGCTLEAQEFQAVLSEIQQRGAAVAGVSPDSVESHCAFAAKHKLAFELLSDPDHALAEAYGVWVEKNLYGRKYMGVQRATFLIDAAGRIARVWAKVRPRGHAREVLDALDPLR